MAILPDRPELTTPADGDLYVTTDVSDTTDAGTGTDKKITWASIKDGLKTYFDTLYAAALGADDNYVTDAEKAALHDAVTLAGTPNYITIIGQVITRSLIDLASHITGRLPFANLTQLSAHSVLARAVAGTGDVAGITMGNNTILGRSGSGDVDDLSATQVRTMLNVEDGAQVNTVTPTNTVTLTNKRMTKRTGTVASAANPTINTDNVDEYYITAQAVDITSFSTNLSGTPTLGQQLFISVIGTAARAITWGASFANGPVALPTTTVTTTQLSVFFKWDGTVWRCYASGSTV